MLGFWCSLYQESTVYTNVHVHTFNLYSIYINCLKTLYIYLLYYIVYIVAKVGLWVLYIED